MPAQSWRKCTGADLVLLTIGGSVTGAELRNLASTAGDLSETMQAAADEILKQAQKRVHRLGVRSVTLQTGWGDPGDAIIDAVRQLKADMLVVGRRGQSRLVRLVPRQRLAKTGKLCAMRCYGRSIAYSTCAAQVSA